MTVLITGVTGFLGSHFARTLAARGCRVIGATSRAAGLQSDTAGVAQKVVFRLGGEFRPDIVRGVDTVIHCAWDLRRGATSDNVTDTKRLVEAAEAAGVTHQIFISTISAHPAAVSGYGRSKLAVQEYMLARGHASVRLGLVIGPGGIFRRLADIVTRSRFVPLADGGRGEVPVVGIDDLQRALAHLVERRLTGLFNLFNPRFVSLRDVLLEVCAVRGRRPVMMSVPSKLLLGPLTLLQHVGITLPIDADNLRGWRANLGVRAASDLLAFVPEPLTLAQMVRAAIPTAPKAQLA